MSVPVAISVTSRRELLLGATGTAAVATFLISTAAEAQDKPPDAWAEAWRKAVGDAKPSEGRIKLTLPPLAENSNIVPYTIEVESPMSELDYVKTIHVFATANPVPTIATYRLTPQSGQAIVASRMRLARTQDVVVVAEMSNGRMVMAKRAIEVTIGGCGGN